MSEEKSIKYQANSSCVIKSAILMTTLFYKALMLQGEIWCWSLFGLKGLSSCIPAGKATLLRRRNLNPVSDVCLAGLISLLWVPNRLNELLEMLFKFPFNLIGKLTMADLTGQSWHILKTWYKSGGPGHRFWNCFTDQFYIFVEISLSAEFSRTQWYLKCIGQCLGSGVGALVKVLASH